MFNGIANYPLSIAFEADDESTHVEVDHQPGIVTDATFLPGGGGIGAIGRF